MRLHQKSIWVLLLLLFAGCKSHYADNNAGTPIVIIDTVYLWHQIDSIDYFTSVRDTANCKRILAKFKTPILVKQLPRIVYHAFFMPALPCRKQT
ncbi:MAG: hypothetical protein JSS64_02535 [Bacteroidetes bacterium]|nr:hypothetical protein [Bacteroidota bacterium]